MFRTIFHVTILAILLGAGSADAEDNAGVSGEKDFNMYCADCHGETGKGDGPKAFGLSINPPDLTQLTAKYGKFPSERLVRVIDGRDPSEGHSEREMPLWGKWFKLEAGEELGGAEGDDASVERRIRNVVGHIESLQQQ